MKEIDFLEKQQRVQKERDRLTTLRVINRFGNTKQKFINRIKNKLARKARRINW